MGIALRHKEVDESFLQGEPDHEQGGVDLQKECTPALPQPPATAFAMPTTFGENIMEDQNWHTTKAPREQPMKTRSMM
jgi:hypothetical protein